MTNVSRTWIPAPIKLCMMELWEYLKDDSAVSSEDWTPRIDDDSRWYIASEDGQVAACFWMRKVNAVTWEAHANVRPKFWGSKRGTAMCQAAIEVMISDTGAKKVVATIPDSSPATQRMAETIGFTREGVCKRSFLKNGKLYDQAYYGITRK